MAKVISIIEESPKHEQESENVLCAVAELSGILTRANGEVVDLGVLGRKVVTTVFVNLLVDTLQANGTTNPITGFLYHGAGTGTGAEAVGDIALGAEIEAAGDTIRATGSQGDGTGANIYKTIGTITFPNTYTVTEHGIFNAGNPGGGGSLMDRTKWAGTSVVANDTIQFTYNLTFTAGG